MIASFRVPSGLVPHSFEAGDEATYHGKPVTVIPYLTTDVPSVRIMFVRVTFPDLKHRFDGCLIRAGALKKVTTTAP